LLIGLVFAGLVAFCVNAEFALRRRRFTDTIMAQFPTGTLARIAKVLAPGETRIDLIRLAVSRELARRHRQRRRARLYVAEDYVQPDSDEQDGNAP
jgi:hypothetical protein